MRIKFEAIDCLFYRLFSLKWFTLITWVFVNTICACSYLITCDGAKFTVVKIPKEIYDWKVYSHHGISKVTNEFIKMNSLLECTWIAPQQTPKGRGKCSKNMQELKANVNQMIIIWAQSASWIENHHQVRK